MTGSLQSFFVFYRQNNNVSKSVHDSRYTIDHVILVVSGCSQRFQHERRENASNALSSFLLPPDKKNYSRQSPLKISPPALFPSPSLSAREENGLLRRIKAVRASKQQPRSVNNRENPTERAKSKNSFY